MPLKIDIDHFPKRTRLYMQHALYAMPRPFKTRLSSSREGLHLYVPECQEMDFRRMIYDDPMRIALDAQRTRLNIPVKNLLWDEKNGKTTGDWWMIRTERDIERFLDAIKPLTIRDDVYRRRRVLNGKNRRRKTKP